MILLVLLRCYCWCYQSITCETSATKSICGRFSGIAYPQKGLVNPPSTFESWLELVAALIVLRYSGNILLLLHMVHGSQC